MQPPDCSTQRTGINQCSPAQSIPRPASQVVYNENRNIDPPRLTDDELNAHWTRRSWLVLHAKMRGLRRSHYPAPLQPRVHPAVLNYREERLEKLAHRMDAIEQKLDKAEEPKPRRLLS